MKIPTRRTIFGHLELGDALVISGMVRHLAKDGAPLELFTGHNSWEAVRRLYTDLPNVSVWWLLNYDEYARRWRDESPDALTLGYFAPPEALFDPARWDAEFYRQAKLPFDLKWSAFHLPAALLGLDPAPRRTALVHDIPSRGFCIDILRVSPRDGCTVVPMTQRNTVWDWITELRAAEEIHVVDSVFLSLADLLWAKGWLLAQRLVYHKYARSAAPPTLRGPWEILT